MKKFTSMILVLLMFLFVLTGCSNSKKMGIEEKNIAELEYIEGNLVSILNKMISGEYSALDDKEEGIEKNDISWNNVLEDTRKIENALATTIVDLTALNIETGEISKLSDGVNNMIVAIGNKNEDEYLIELSNVYSLIPSYMEKYVDNKDRVFKSKIKYYIVSAYVAYNDGNLELAQKQSEELEKVYSEKMQDLGYIQDNEYNVNKLYILIKEFKRAIESDNEELVKSKYLLFIKEI